jgi:cyclin-dependent kinase regulatory subunit CKS1
MARLAYSDVYSDDTFDYRHVHMPLQVMNKVRALITLGGALLTEKQWREVGIQMSKGWVHYSWHRPELNLLLFRRPKKTADVTPTKKDEEDEEPNEPEKPRKAKTAMKFRRELMNDEEHHRKANTTMKVGKRNGDDDKNLTSSMKKLRLSPASSSSSSSE